MTHFTDLQQQFMAHILDPENHPILDGIEDRRMGIYRELFFNNIKGFLNSGFPVLASLYSEKAWDELARTFFKSHDCRSPYFIDISKEFVEFLSHQYQLTEHDFGFLPDLAHYEWLELDISVRSAEIASSIWRKGDDINQLSMSPLAQLVSYRFPVHQISIDNIPTSPLSEPVYIVVHRDEQDEVHFSEINVMTALLLDTVQQNEEMSLQQLTIALQQHLKTIAESQLQLFIREVVEDLLQQQILISRKANIAN